MIHLKRMTQTERIFRPSDSQRNLNLNSNSSSNAAGEYGDGGENADLVIGQMLFLVSLVVMY